MQYATIHDAISFIKCSPQSVYMAKVDVALLLVLK